MSPSEVVTVGPVNTSAGVQAMADEHRALAKRLRAAIAQECDSCGTGQFPPLLSCPVCGSSSMNWVSCGDAGTVGTFVTVHTRQATASMSIPRRLRDAAPYTSVFASPDALPTVRVAALMLGDQQAEMRVGARVTFAFSDDYGLMVDLASRR
jgi:uncharacterized OB-fold protein